MIVMIKKIKQENEEIIRNTIGFLENSGYENIKADIKGYENPKSFLMRGQNITVTPDIVAETNGKKHYIEIGYKTADKRLLKSKWKFLSTLSELKGRHFKVVSHKGHYGFTDRLIKEMGLELNVVRI